MVEHVCKNCGWYQDILSHVHKLHLYRVHKIIEDHCSQCTTGGIEVVVRDHWKVRRSDRRKKND